MSLNVALNNAISGMQLNQQSLSVLSQNIANVNTEGYSRQVINQSAVVVDGVGQGVTVDSITRKIDTYLQRAQQTQNGVAGNASVVNDYYQRLQVLLGAPGAQNSVDAYLTGFFNSLQSVADAPDSISGRSILVNSAQTLATQISGLAQKIEDLRFQADNEITSNITTINASLEKLHGINLALQRASVLGQSTAGLLDERDRELKVLSQNLNISTSFDDSGAVSVSSGTGIALVDVLTHQLSYQAVPSAQNFYTDQILNPVIVITLDTNGEPIGNPDVLISGGTSDKVVSHVASGNLAALQSLRDHVLPGILDQLDQLAAGLRNTVNKVHNQGSGFPPPSVLTGERLVAPGDTSNWSGFVRIAALGVNGSPLGTAYNDESTTGIRPLTIDMSALNAGTVNGQPDVQAIIDEINNHFGSPPTKTKLGVLNSIQMVSDTKTLPGGAPPLFTFDFDAENITRAAANMFVTGISVLDDTATDITNVTAGPPGVTLDTVNTYTTTLGSADVDVALLSTTGLSLGQTIFLGSPSAAVVLSGIDGIAAADMTGYFTIKAISGNTITVTNTAGTLALTGTSVADASPTSLVTEYDTIAAGTKARTRDSGGKFQVNLIGNPTSSFYDITVTVSVQDNSGAIQTSDITYRVPNGTSNQLNVRINSTAVSGAAQRVPPNTTQSTMRAMLVDADGVEIPRVGGRYLDQSGYLKLVASNSSTALVIDSLDSLQLGNPTFVPPIAASNQGFSSYFALNNFFTSNHIVSAGDTVKGSALHFAVEQRILDNPSLVSTGALVQQSQPADPAKPPQYTYVRYAGDNSVAQKMAGLNSAVISFGTAGGLPATQVSLQSYAGSVLADISSKTVAAGDIHDNAQSLLNGFKERAQSISGVNLDEELANTIIFQNAYSATARIINVVGKMYESLLNAF